MTTLDAPAVRWPLRTPPADYVIGNVSAVLPDRILTTSGSSSATAGSPPLKTPVAGAPMLTVPWEFALVSFEGKLRAAGITTVYHGASFQQPHSAKPARSVEAALQMCALVGERNSHGPVDHRVLHRLDVRSDAGFAALRRHLSTVAQTALVSHEDHTPGQGQYADRRFLERYLAGAQGISEGEARRRVDAKIAERDADGHLRERALQWLGEQARTGRSGWSVTTRPRPRRSSSCTTAEDP